MKGIQWYLFLRYKEKPRNLRKSRLRCDLITFYLCKARNLFKTVNKKNLRAKIGTGDGRTEKNCGAKGRKKIISFSYYQDM